LPGRGQRQAVYRFPFINRRVTEAEILAGHFQATRERCAATDAAVLILHDTTEFSYHRAGIRAIGMIHRSPIGLDRNGKHQARRQYSGGHRQAGMHLDAPHYVVSRAMKRWTSSEFKGCNALKRKINPTRVPN
jgi:hypothetical protein